MHILLRTAWDYDDNHSYPAGMEGMAIGPFSTPLDAALEAINAACNRCGYEYVSFFADVAAVHDSPLKRYLYEQYMDNVRYIRAEDVELVAASCWRDLHEVVELQTPGDE